MKIYNTLTRKKEEFIPLVPGEARIYACGPTVYNFIHIGNARPLITFDALRRYLEYRGMKVTFVQNFTDVDDKMIRRAQAEHSTVKEVAEKYIAEYYTDARGLNVREATVHPRATENMGEILSLIGTLVEKGYAYESGGDVYFRARRFQEYGKLSHQPLEDLEAGARVDLNESKEDPMDFALWKAQKPGEPAWDSPWGKGRPGWHIECSAMARRYLGETIDIHGGGQDLIFPHHENEIAQSECANGAPFARYWMHNGYVNVDNHKMSKSLNNFFTVRDVAKEYGYEPIRFLMLSAQYRNPINYSAEILEQSKSALARLYNCRDSLDFAVSSAPAETLDGDDAFIEELGAHRARFIEAMDDDLNTADALSAVFELVRQANLRINAEGGISRKAAQAAAALLGELCGVLGLLTERKEKSLDREIEEMIEQRQQARKRRDFKTADAIRDALREKGVILEDSPQGVKWSLAEK
jgi:cysteinyl-tRNA synthetase